MDERSIFDYVTHDVDSILEKIEIRFDYRKQNKMFSENNLKNLTYVEKYDATYGRCFGIDINGYDLGGIYKTVIIAKMSVYIFVQQNGQFSENGKSRLEIQLGKCLFIELSYEIFIQNMDTGCSTHNPDGCKCLDYDNVRTYDDCNEEAIELNMMDKNKCVVPFLRSNKTICKDKYDKEQVVRIKSP